MGSAEGAPFRKTRALIAASITWIVKPYEPRHAPRRGYQTRFSLSLSLARQILFPPKIFRELITRFASDQQRLPVRYARTRYRCKAVPPILFLNTRVSGHGKPRRVRVFSNRDANFLRVNTYEPHRGLAAFCFKRELRNRSISDVPCPQEDKKHCEIITEREKYLSEFTYITRIIIHMYDFFCNQSSSFERKCKDG